MFVKWRPFSFVTVTFSDTPEPSPISLNFCSKYGRSTSIFMNFSISSGVKKRMLCWSMKSERLMRRPPDSCIPRQLRNELVIKSYAGITETVLSQLRTFTDVSVMSMTEPSAWWRSISIQSPLRKRSDKFIWIPETKPRIESLKTNNKTVAMAPRVDKIITGLLFTICEATRIVATQNIASFMAWKMPRIGRSFIFTLRSFKLSMTSSTALASKNAATVNKIFPICSQNS